MNEMFLINFHNNYSEYTDHNNRWIKHFLSKNINSPISPHNHDH